MASEAGRLDDLQRQIDELGTMLLARIRRLEEASAVLPAWPHNWHLQDIKPDRDVAYVARFVVEDGKKNPGLRSECWRVGGGATIPAAIAAALRDTP